MPLLGWHHSKASRKAMSLAHLGKSLSREHCAALSAARAGKPLSQEHKNSLSLSLKGRRMNSSWRKKIGLGALGNNNAAGKRSLETRARISESNCGNRNASGKRSQEFCRRMSKLLADRELSKETCDKMSAAVTRRWQDPIEAHKLINGWLESPTLPEILTGTLLNKLYPGEFSYNGRGPVIVDGRVPDFVHNNGRHLAIAVNGDYWHKGEDIRALKSHYAKSGYKLLVIWEHEINSDWSKLEQKLSKFVEAKF